MYAKLAFIKLLTAGTTNNELPQPTAAGKTSVEDLKVYIIVIILAINFNYIFDDRVMTSSFGKLQNSDLYVARDYH